jgi:DNA-binding SARP family transcriptional activator
VDTPIDVRILGTLEVLRDGEPVALGTPKMRDLLAVLVLEAPTPVSADVLAEQLWGDRAPSDAYGSIQSYVSRLRSSLETARDVLVTRGGAYLLQVDRGAIDATRFERSIRDARARRDAGKDEEAAAAFRDGLALWRGSALQDVGGTRVEAEAARLNELRLAVLEECLDAELACRAPADVAAELEALTAQHPSRERFWAQRMRALYLAGRQADALATYEELRHRLADELGLDPSEELRRLHEAILRQDASLAAGRPPVAAGSSTRLQIHVDGPSGPVDLEVAGRSMTIGRAPENDVVVSDPRVSGTHAALERVGNAWSIRDLGSRNGTFVNGSRLQGERVVAATDEIRIGDSTLRCRVTAPSTPPTIGVVRAPELDARERRILLELCRPIATAGSGGEPASPATIAEALGTSAADVRRALSVLGERFGVGDDPVVIAAHAIESGAVSIAEL